MESADTGLLMVEHIFSGDLHSSVTDSSRKSQCLNRNVHLVVRETDGQVSKTQSSESAFRKINEMDQIAKAGHNDQRSHAQTRKLPTQFPLLVICLIILFCLCFHGQPELLSNVLHGQHIDALVGLNSKMVQIRPLLTLDLLQAKISLMKLSFYSKKSLRFCDTVLSRDFSPEPQTWKLSHSRRCRREMKAVMGSIPLDLPYPTHCSLQYLGGAWRNHSECSWDTTRSSATCCLW